METEATEVKLQGVTVSWDSLLLSGLLEKMPINSIKNGENEPLQMIPRQCSGLVIMLKFIMHKHQRKPLKWVVRNVKMNIYGGCIQSSSAWSPVEARDIFSFFCSESYRPLRFMTWVTDIPPWLIYFDPLGLQRQICNPPIFRGCPLFSSQPSQTTHTSKLPLRSC